MIIKRKDTWGNLFYDTKYHKFNYKLNCNSREVPYITKPIVLNVDLTFRCNMDCVHCVAKDTAKILGGVENSDLEITLDLIRKINVSEFIVVVITGGEPLLKEYESELISLIKGLKNKGIIIDTNGTIFPSNKLLKIFQRKNILIRVSWDIPNPKEEYNLRKYTKNMFESKDRYIIEKQKLIKYLVKNNIKTAIQSTMHGQNFKDRNFHRFPLKLNELGVKTWFIQRFIPSYKKINDKKYFIEVSDYNNSIEKLVNISKRYNIRCFTKKDRRHNSVFILVKNGDIYTQSDDVPGEKICLGKIGNINNYFEFVSSTEHSLRYY